MAVTKIGVIYRTSDGIITARCLPDVEPVIDDNGEFIQHFSNPYATDANLIPFSKMVGDGESYYEVPYDLYDGTTQSLDSIQQYMDLVNSGVTIEGV